jgi:hydrogenase small subunit
LRRQLGISPARQPPPTVADVILDMISVNYQKTLVATAGSQAEDVLTQTLRDDAGKFSASVEGSIPPGVGGAYCTIGGNLSETAPGVGRPY